MIFHIFLYLKCVLSLFKIVYCFSSSINCFFCFFVTSSLESSNLFYITSFLGSFKSFFSFYLFFQFFGSRLITFFQLKPLRISFFSLNLQENFSMFSDLNLLLFLSLNVFISSNMLSYFFLFLLILLNLLESFSMLGNLFFFLNLLEVFSVFLYLILFPGFLKYLPVFCNLIVVSCFGYFLCALFFNEYDLLLFFIILNWSGF